MKSRVAALAVAALVCLPVSASAMPAAAGRPACKPADPALPAWARERQALVLVDSVLLGGFPRLVRTMPCWRLQRFGRPAIMVRIADRELRARTRVPKLVILGIAYNSLFERNRHRYRYWSDRWDREAASILKTLRARGARQFVWVKLREPHRGIVNALGRSELHLYSWFFPYVNERLRVLDERRDDLVLADWTTAANRPGITYDSIHVNDRGALLLARTIKKAVLAEALRQARR